MLQECIPTYNYLTQGHFQNPDILSSAIIHFTEFNTALLTYSYYKDLFDIKSQVKIDFKNMHPENVSKDVPIIISTNDDVLTVLNSLPYKRPSLFNSSVVTTTVSSSVTTDSVEAAIRRLYMIPFRSGRYNDLHCNISRSDPPHLYEELCKYNNMLAEEGNVLERLFNFLIAFACC